MEAPIKEAEAFVDAYLEWSEMVAQLEEFRGKFMALDGIMQSAEFKGRKISLQKGIWWIKKMYINPKRVSTKKTPVLSEPLGDLKDIEDLMPEDISDQLVN
jgi:hypothetical protein